MTSRPSTDPFFTSKHQREGYVSISRTADGFYVRCHWPIDLDRDQFFDLTDRFPVNDYVSAVNSFMDTGRSPVVHGDHSTLTLDCRRGFPVILRFGLPKGSIIAEHEIPFRDQQAESLLP